MVSADDGRKSIEGILVCKYRNKKYYPSSISPAMAATAATISIVSTA